LHPSLARILCVTPRRQTLRVLSAFATYSDLRKKGRSPTFLYRIEVIQAAVQSHVMLSICARSLGGLAESRLRDRVSGIDGSIDSSKYLMKEFIPLGRRVFMRRF
jgi:hypothetical protein